MFQADGKRFVLFTYLTIGYDTVSLSTATKFNSSLNTVNTSKQTNKKWLENPVPYSELLLVVLKMVKLDH